MIITIDGPAASGKTTIARLLAQRLNYFYLSSGLLFRGLAYVLINEYYYNEEQLLQPREKDLHDVLQPNRFMYTYDAQKQEQLFFDGTNITSLLRDKGISKYASMIATNIPVRNALAVIQYNIANNRDLVAEGRDMGSIIFPKAQIKFFLTASLEVRAKRWQSDQEKKGNKLTLDQAQEEIKSRDERDANRRVAPLCVPNDAIIIDDSMLNKEQVIIMMEQRIRKLF